MSHPAYARNESTALPLHLVDRAGYAAWRDAQPPAIAAWLETQGFDAAPGSAVLQELFQVIEDRKVHPKEGSYTNYLLDKGVEKICKKVGEEASETIIAAVKGNNDELRYEVADLFYHVLVLLADRCLTPEDVYAELGKRRS